MDLGSELRRMRRGAGFNQNEMADMMHVSRSNISRMESNNIELKAIDLLKWCKITNNPDVLMALYAGIEVVNQLQPLTQLITGTITILGGII